jgi:hypothetical protein
MGVKNTLSLFFNYLSLLDFNRDLQTKINNLPTFNNVRQKEKKIPFVSFISS